MVIVVSLARLLTDRAFGPPLIAAEDGSPIVARRVISPAAFTDRDIEDVLPLSANDRHVAVTGHVVYCAPVGRSVIEVTVSQAATGALAKGRGWVGCATGSTAWDAKANAYGPDGFSAGTADVCAVARIRERG